MKTFAYCPANTVREVYKGDKLFDMHPKVAEKWVEAPDNVQVGWQFDGKAFAPPTPVSVDIQNAQNRRYLLAQISWLESKQLRPLRDIALGKGDTPNGNDNKTPQQRLKDLDDQISELRTQIKE